MSADPAHISAAGGSAQPDQAQVGASLERLRELLLGEGGLMASLVDPSRSDDHAAQAADTGPAQIAASGPRVDGRGADYELLVEAIYEGYLMHYHAPRVMRAPEDDLGLLAGDRLYALGLARLVKLGDVEAVAELSDVITLSALAQGSGNPELAEAVWIAGAHAVGWGASPRHEQAKALTRAGSPDALEAMRGLDGA